MKITLKQLKQIIKEQVNLNEEHRDWQDEMNQIGSQVLAAVEHALEGAMSEYNIVLTPGEIRAVAETAARAARQAVKSKLVPATHMDM